MANFGVRLFLIQPRVYRKPGLTQGRLIKVNFRDALRRTAPPGSCRVLQIYSANAADVADCSEGDRLRSNMQVGERRGQGQVP